MKLTFASENTQVSQHLQQAGIVTCEVEVRYASYSSDGRFIHGLKLIKVTGHDDPMVFFRALLPYKSA